MAQRVLVLAPHPDDESLGCGGTLREHLLAGDHVEVLFLTSGERGCHGAPPEETGPRREAEALAALTCLGAARAHFWRLADGGLRADEAAVARLAAQLLAGRYDVLYLPHAGEAHADHRAAAEITARALRRAGGAAPAQAWAYEVWTPLAELDRVVDVTPHLPAKLQAIREYRSQAGAIDFAASFEGLARYRGELFCWPEGRDGRDCRYAEVFAAVAVRGGARDS
ncbi:MAG TPA: PIG-L deacetylase family protein [Planctomycetota bacterium]